MGGRGILQSGYAGPKSGTYHVSIVPPAGPLPLTQEHWFTVRCLWGEWWNLNSLFPAPQPLGQFYLSAFLASLQEQGYQILVVRSGAYW